MDKQDMLVTANSNEKKVETASENISIQKTIQ